MRETKDQKKETRSASSLMPLLDGQKISGKKLKEIITVAEIKLSQDTEILRRVKNVLPKNHFRQYRSNHSECEEFYFSGRKETLERWIRDVIENSNLHI